jgi:hypothetical protein
MAVMRVCEWTALLTISMLVPATVRTQEPHAELWTSQSIEPGLENSETASETIDSFLAFLNRSNCFHRDHSEAGKRSHARRAKRSSSRTDSCSLRTNCRAASRCAWLDLNADAAAIALFQRKPMREELAFCCRRLEDCAWQSIVPFNPRLRTFPESLETVYLADASEIFAANLCESVASVGEAEGDIRADGLGDWSIRSESVPWLAEFGVKSRVVTLHRFNQIESSADNFWRAWNGRSPFFENREDSYSILNHFFLNDANNPTDNQSIHLIQMLRSLPDQLSLKWTFFY